MRMLKRAIAALLGVLLLLVILYEAFLHRALVSMQSTAQFSSKNMAFARRCAGRILCSSLSSGLSYSRCSIFPTAS